RRILRTLPESRVTVLDLLTYAGHKENLEDAFSNDRFVFVQGDIRNETTVMQAMDGCDCVVHFAAESHVDRSIADASGFISTNVHGSYILLQTAAKLGVKRFLNVGTDEVYGPIPKR